MCLFVANRFGFSLACIVGESFTFVCDFSVLNFRLFPGLRREKEARIGARQKMREQTAFQT